MAENQPNGINPETAAPVSPEAVKTKELLNREKAGLQAALLMDAKKDTSENTVKALDDIKAKTEGPNLEKVTKSSKSERDNYWKGKKNGEDKLMTFDEQKAEWVRNTDQLFNAFRSNSEQNDLLVKLGYGKDKNAEDFYKEFFVTGKGNLGFFGKKIAENFSEEDLLNAKKKSLTITEQDKDGNETQKQISLLEVLGNFYGQNSTEVAKLVAEGMVNLKNNEEEFKKTASLQIANLSDEDNNFLKKIDGMSDTWDEDERKRLEEKKKKLDEQRKKGEEAIAFSEAATALYTKIESSGTDLLKEFLPILEKYKTKPGDISDEAFSKAAKAAVDTFTKAEAMSGKTEDEQLLNIISLFDAISLTDRSKFGEKDTKFYSDSLSTIIEALGKKDVTLIGLNTPIEKVKDIAELVKVETSEEDRDQEIVTRAGFMKGDKVFRKPVVAVSVPKKSGGEPAEAEPGNASREKISKEMTELADSIANSDHEFIKHFLPVLQGFAEKSKDIKDYLYTPLSEALISAFKGAEKLSDRPEREQALALLGYLDMLTISPQMIRLEQNEIKLLQEKEEGFIKLLAEKDIKPIEIPEGGNFDPDTMDVISKIPVDDDEKVNKALNIQKIYGFKMGDEVLRKYKVQLGVKEQTAGAQADTKPDETKPAEGAEQKPDEPATDWGTLGLGEKLNAISNDPKIGTITANEQTIITASGSLDEAKASLMAYRESNNQAGTADKAQEQKVQPTQAEFNAQLEQAKFLADGRELTDNEKNRIANGEKAKDVIKIDTTASNQAPDGNENK